MAFSTQESHILERFTWWGALVRFLRASPAIALVAAALLVIMILGSILAPVFYSWQEMIGVDLRNSLQGPSWAHPFGTDELGRDMLGRILWGGRITLLVAVVAVGSSMIVGVSIGALCGYYDNWLTSLVMRFMDFMIAFPRTLLAIVVITVVGPGVVSLTIAIAISTVPAKARLFRGPVLSLSKRQYVTAAKALGTGNLTIIFSHIVPNTVSLMIVQGTLSLAEAILVASGLSFLGLGPQPPTPEWGAMIAGARGYMTSNPHMVLFPGTVLFLVILSFNVLGDALRDYLDPRAFKADRG